MIGEESDVGEEVCEFVRRRVCGELVREAWCVVLVHALCACGVGLLVS